MTDGNAMERTNSVRKRLKAATSARWNDEQSVEIRSQYADDITKHEDRYVWKRVIRDVVGDESWQVLNMGTGAGFLVGLYAGLGHGVVSCDFSGSMLDQARERAARDGFEATFTAGDAEALPFDDVTLNVVTNRAMIWSLPNPGLAVREWYRVLRPGGQVVLFGNHSEDSTRASCRRRDLSQRHRGARGVRARTTVEWLARYCCAWDDAKTDLPFHHAPPSKIQALFDAAGFQGTRVFDVADEVEQWRTLGPWRSASRGMSSPAENPNNSYLWLEQR